MTQKKEEHPQSQYAKRAKDPWIIASSIKGSHKIARIVKDIYEARMQVEQNFRDDKNFRWGFGFRLGRTIKKERVAILLLIASIATLCLWLIGCATENLNLHRVFQANSIKNKRVLSLVYLDKNVIKQNTIYKKLKKCQIKNALESIALISNAYASG